MAIKILNVGLTGDEMESHIYQQEYIVIVELDGVKYRMRIKKGKRADGNSTPWIICWLLKANGPHVDSGDCHDALYEDPYVYTMENNHRLRISKAECDTIFYKLLAGDTGLLDFEFKANTPTYIILWYWIRFKKAPEFIMKNRVCPKWIIKVAGIFLATVGWLAWIKWRLIERKKNV